MSGLDRRSFLAHAAGGLAAIAITPEMLAAAHYSGAAPMNLGLIGAGRHGRAILAEIQKIDGAKVTAICDTDEQRLAAAQRRSAGATGYATHRELLDKAKDVQAVIIATPTHTHRGVAADALGAGRHVFCEAPLAHTVEDSRAIALAARGAGTVFAAGFQGRSTPLYKLARTFYLSDAVRDLVAMRAQFCRKNSWRVPADSPERDKALNWRLDPEVSTGLAGEIGSSQFDVFGWYTGRLPKRVRGHGGIRLHDDGREVADTIHCEIEYEGGAWLSYDATLANSYEGQYELFRGTNAAIKLAWTHGWMFKEADAPTQGWEVYANRVVFHNDEGITLIANATQLANQGKDLKEATALPQPPLYYALSDFLNAIADGKAPATSAEEGHRATVVGILANKAVVSGGEVEILESDLRVS